MTSDQIGEAGEAFNDAMRNAVISTELRGRLVIDLRQSLHAIGDVDLIAGARKVRGDAKTNSAYLGALDAYIAILTGSQAAPSVTPTAPTPAPAPVPVSSVPAATGYPIGAYKIAIRPLTNAEQRNAIDALVRGGYMPGAVKIESDFAKGFYPVCDPAVIEPIKEIFWRDITPTEDKAALKLFLSAIDQRNMTTNQLLPLSEAIAIAGTLNAGTSVSAPTAGAPQGSVQVVYTQELVMVNPETGFTIWIAMSSNDDGLRVDYNTKYPWQGGAPSNPKLPQLFLFFERDGGVSINGKPPAVDSNGNPTRLGQYDNLRGKDLVFYPNGFNRPDGEGKGKSADIACMQAGRTIRFGASFNTADPQFPLEIRPDGVEVNGRPI